MKFKILISDKLGEAGLERLQAATDVEFDVKLGLSKAELVAAIPPYNALIIRSGTVVDADLLTAGQQLRVIGRAGIGVDNVDIRAATLRGVIVMNTPQANSIATAEQTMALMLAISRHTAPAHASLKAGDWNRSEYTGQQLYRKCLGIIGLGRIGRLVAARAQSFGMEVSAYDPFVSEEVARELKVTLLDLDDLLAKADYISLHTAQTPETIKMINAAALAKMKPTAILINVARGKLIDEAALADALRHGRLGGAAIDVYSQEPPGDNPLLGLKNVLHTPHLGASSFEAQRDVATQIVDQVLDALRGNDFRNAVNMPFRAGPDFNQNRPYMALAETIGALHACLARSPIRRVDVEVRGEAVDKMVKPITAALLKGLLEHSLLTESVNYINAPVLAEEHGIVVSETKGMSVVDYPNLISIKVVFDDRERLLAGVLFGGNQPRIVQLNQFHLEARPEGTVLLMLNADVPGVIGQVGTLLAAYEVNIGEWRLGRDRPGGSALSFINLDSEPPAEVLEALRKIPAIEQVELVSL